MVAAMVEMVVKAPTPPTMGGGLGNREPGSYIYIYIIHMT